MACGNGPAASAAFGGGETVDAETTSGTEIMCPATAAPQPLQRMLRDRVMVDQTLP
jgi:hypothetical protein